MYFYIFIDKEKRSIGKQLSLTYGILKSSLNPVHLYITSFDDQSTALFTMKQNRGMQTEKIVSKTFKPVKLDSFPYLKLLELWRKKCVTMTVARLQAEKVRTSSYGGSIIYLVSSLDYDCFSLLLCFCFSFISLCQLSLPAHSSCNLKVFFSAPLLPLVLQMFCFHITISYRSCMLRTYRICMAHCAL